MRKLIIGIILAIILVLGALGSTVMADRPENTPIESLDEITMKIGDFTKFGWTTIAGALEDIYDVIKDSDYGLEAIDDEIEVIDGTVDVIEEKIYSIEEEIESLAGDVTELQTTMEQDVDVWQAEITVGPGESELITFEGERPGRLYLTLSVEGGNWDEEEDSIWLNTYIVDEPLLYKVPPSLKVDYEINTDHTEIVIDNQDDLSSEDIGVKYIAVKMS